MKKWGLDSEDIDRAFKEDFGLSERDKWEVYFEESEKYFAGKPNNYLRTIEPVDLEECWFRYFVEHLGLTIEEAEEHLDAMNQWKKKQEEKINRATSKKWHKAGSKPNDVPKGFYIPPRFNQDDDDDDDYDYPSLSTSHYLKKVSLKGAIVPISPEGVIDYIGRRLVICKILPVPELSIDEIIAGLAEENAVIKAEHADDELDDIGDKLEKAMPGFRVVTNNYDVAAMLQPKHVAADIERCVEFICQYVKKCPDQLIPVANEIYAMNNFYNTFLAYHDDPDRYAMYRGIANVLGGGFAPEVGSNFLKFRSQVLLKLAQIESGGESQEESEESAFA